MAKILQAMQLPLNQNTLIEASAGTGKTYTIVTLFIRLLLNIDSAKAQRQKALEVEEILVVTFTKAATQELKGRILERISEIKQIFKRIEKGEELEGIVAKDKDPILYQIYQQVETALPEAILRLELAEENMDSAAVFTIHSFAQRMLQRYALQSKIPFGLEIDNDESTLRTALCREYWRRNFYPLEIEKAKLVSEWIGSPDNLLVNIYPFLSGDFTIGSVAKPELASYSATQLLEDFAKEQARHVKSIQYLKKKWSENIDEVTALFIEIFEKKHKTINFNGSKYRKKQVLELLDKIKEWVKNDSSAVPNNFWKYLSYREEHEGKLASDIYLKSSKDRLEDTKFAELFALTSDDAYEQPDAMPYCNMLLWIIAQDIKAQLREHKFGHREKSYDDLLSLLQQALTSTEGQDLATLIGQQYPFAMIDEFQDTDAQQYEIFSRIYLDPQRDNHNTTMIMIGDPKQSIYAFRNADIYTYLEAAKSLQETTYTLDTNWRSTPEMITVSNKLFSSNIDEKVKDDGDDNIKQFLPFLHPLIHYEKINPSPKSHNKLHFANREVAAFNAFLQPELDQGDNKLSGGAAKELLARQCAADIAQWLSGDEGNYIASGDDQRAVKASDIAVLVKSRGEAELIQRALAKYKIQSVYLSDRSNLLESEWATYMNWLLQACLNPYKESHILKVLSSPLFLYSAEELLQIRAKEQRWELWVEHFIRFNHIWREQGVLPMLHAILLDKTLSIVERFQQTHYAERALTDYLHLAELLQKGSKLHKSPTALTGWYEHELKKNKGAEGEGEYQKRLESEKDLVQIVTIHKSKGLEYGIVWLPFIGLTSSQQRTGVNGISRYHDESGKAFWDLDHLHSEKIIEEQSEEALRLLYVAVTRAKYQINIGMKEIYSAKDAWNALVYLLNKSALVVGQKLGVECEGEKLLTNVFSKKNLNIIDIDEEFLAEQEDANTSNYSPVESQHNVLQAREFTRTLEHNWRISSFSSLNQMHQRLRKYMTQQTSSEQGFDLLDEASDHDQQVNSFEESYQEIEPLSAEFLDTPSRFTFPMGAEVGHAIHGIYEKSDFALGVDSELCKEVCNKLALDEVWIDVLQTWMDESLATPLDKKSGLTLKDCAEKDKLVELGFLIAINSPLKVKRFNQILRQYHPLMAENLQREEFNFDHFQGLIKGFIDLVFRADGQYFVADYKTNHLGYRYQDYSEESLKQAIIDHNYDLQYLIYTLALHRYLKERLVNYQYDKHIGGVYYLFIRGMHPDHEQQGIYFDKPSFALIDALDKLLEEKC